MAESNRPRHGGQASRRYPYTTGLQAWTVSLVSQLDLAREQLAPIEWRALVDALVVKIAREAARLGDERILKEAA